MGLMNGIRGVTSQQQANPPTGSRMQFNDPMPMGKGSGQGMPASPTGFGKGSGGQGMQTSPEMFLINLIRNRQAQMANFGQGNAMTNTGRMPMPFSMAPQQNIPATQYTPSITQQNPTAPNQEQFQNLPTNANFDPNKPLPGWTPGQVVNWTNPRTDEHWVTNKYGATYQG